MDRNLDSRLITKEIVLARYIWGREYSKQSGGQVDFWEKLMPSRKLFCKEVIDDLEKVILRSDVVR